MAPEISPAPLSALPTSYQNVIKSVFAILDTRRGDALSKSSENIIREKLQELVRLLVVDVKQAKLLNFPPGFVAESGDLIPTLMDKLAEKEQELEMVQRKMKGNGEKTKDKPTRGPSGFPNQPNSGNNSAHIHDDKGAYLRDNDSGSFKVVDEVFDHSPIKKKKKHRPSRSRSRSPIRSPPRSRERIRGPQSPPLPPNMHHSPVRPPRSPDRGPRSPNRIPRTPERRVSRSRSRSPVRRLKDLPVNIYRFTGIRIRNIYPRVKEMLLRETVEKYGRVMQIEIKDREAVITYDNIEAPRRAIADLHGEFVHRISNFSDKLQVTFSLGFNQDKYHMKNVKKVITDECHFFRTTGCEASDCPEKHIAFCAGIDLQPWMKKSFVP